MSVIYRHIPNWVETDEHTEVSFKTQEELLSIPWVKKWEQPFGKRIFSHWAVSRNKEPGGQHWLMAIYDSGKYRWVVGLLSDAPLPELPDWKCPK